MTNNRQEITFTREQFYEKVWSTPATRIGKELGCSNLMVGKVCKAHDIPTPHIGFWSQLQYGKNPQKTPLPPNDDPNLQILTFVWDPNREETVAQSTPEPKYDADIQQLLDRSRTLDPVQVAESLHRPHPLIAVTRDRIKIDRRPYYEQTEAERNDRRPALDVSAGPEQTNRALCIMDALVKRVEAIGGTVEIRNIQSYQWKHRTVVCFGGDDVCQIRLREKQNQVRVPADKKRGVFDADHELKPSGILVLDEGPSYGNSVLLRDAPKSHKIEEGLNDVIIGFVQKAGDLRIKRRAEEAEARIRQQQEAELRQRQEALKALKRAEQDRIDKLVSHANAWQQSQIVRDYIGALSEMLIKRDGSIAPDGDIAKYLQWAHEQANRLDPLTPSPPSILDEQT